MVVPASSALTVIPKKSSAITASSGGAMAAFKPSEKKKKKTVNKRSFFSNNKFDFSNAFSPKFGGVNFDFSRSSVQANAQVVSALQETNALLQDIGNALALDFANRITEGRGKINASKNALAKARYSAKEAALEGTKKVGSFITGSAKKLLSVTGLGGLFGKIGEFIKFIFVGLVGTSLFKWIQGGGIGKLKDGLAGIWEGITNFVGPIWDKVKSGLSWVGEKLKPIWKPIWNVLKFAGQQITKALRALTAFVIKLKPLAAIGNAFRATGKAIGWTVNRALDAPNRWGRRWKGVKNWGSGLVEKMFPKNQRIESQKGSDAVNKLFGNNASNFTGGPIPKVESLNPNNLVLDQPSTTVIHMQDKVDTSLLKNKEESSGPVTEIIPISPINEGNEYMMQVPEILGIAGVEM